MKVVSPYRFSFASFSFFLKRKGSFFFLREKVWYNKNMKSELLSPAGEKESFLAAIDGGADAIYVGLTAFSARRNAVNFTSEELKPLIDRAHIFGIRVYVAANTLIKDGETEAFLEQLHGAETCGADGLILHDIHLADKVREVTNLPLHLSTQAGVCNIWGAMEAKRKGFSRVILARETAPADIAEISEIIETETFIQGALCSSLSGHCLMSSFAGCNSANRGLCKQPCRKLYRMEGQDGYLISLADLSVGERISELQKAGVTSFKIEGRMRSPEYVYAATSYYRAILDGKEGDLSALKRAYNRGDYTEGYAFGNSAVRYSLANGHIGDSVGRVCRVGKEESLVESAYRPQSGDGFKVLRRGKEVGGTARWRPDKKGFYLNGVFQIGDEVRLTSTQIQREERRLPITAKGAFCAGIPSCVILTANDISVTAEGAKVQPAKNAPMTAEKLDTLFKKTGDFPFVLAHTEWETDGGFLPAKECNEWRRSAYRKLADALIARTVQSRSERKKAEVEQPVPPLLDMDGVKKISVANSADEIVGEETKEVVRVVFPNDYRDEEAVVKTVRKSKEKYVLLYLPAFFDQEDEKYFNKLLPYFDGVYVNGRGGADFARAHETAWVAGVGLGAFCREDAKALYADGASAITLSNELSEGETKEILRVYPNAFVPAAGGIRLMEFLYCPYGGNCKNCNGKDVARLTDDGQRNFYLRRYKISQCRFELYNGRTLSVPYSGKILIDCCPTVSGATDGTTKGHWKRPLPSSIEDGHKGE